MDGLLLELISSRKHYRRFVEWQKQLQNLQILASGTFLTLEETQNRIVLSGNICPDETFYSVRAEGIVSKDDGSKLKGLSINQLCIGVAADKKNSVILLEGTGKPSQKKALEAFQSHIEHGARLIHDDGNPHRRLADKLSLKSTAYSSRHLKGLPDNENPMNPVNRVHAILKNFLNSHSGFKSEDIQGYPNLFSFVTNPPTELLGKVERVVGLGFQNPKLLRYIGFYSANTEL
jgi:hypothetical protein